MLLSRTSYNKINRPETRWTTFSRWQPQLEQLIQMLPIAVLVSLGWEGLMNQSEHFLAFVPCPATLALVRPLSVTFQLIQQVESVTETTPIGCSSSQNTRNKMLQTVITRFQLLDLFTVRSSQILPE